MKKIHKSLALLVTVLLSAVLLLVGCQETGVEQSEKLPSFSSYRDIPGVTKEEIRAVEELLKQNAFFAYGMSPSSEAFFDKNGKAKGYAAHVSGWLSELFGVPFVLQLHPRNDLLEGLASGAIDFSGDMMSIVPGQDVNAKTDPIARRSVKLFRIAGSEPLHEIAKSRAVRYALLQNSADSFNVLQITRGQEFDFVFVEEYIHAYKLLKSGKVDALVAVSTAESVFDIYDDVVTSYYVPLIDLSAFMMTQKSELTPIISVVNKALKNGAIHDLDRMYNQGYHDYLRHKFYLRLSEEEREYLSNNPVIPVVAQYDNYPVSFYNEHEQKWQGVFFDFIQEFKALSGLEFRMVNENKTKMSALVQALESKEALMIAELGRAKISKAKGLKGRFSLANIPLYEEHPIFISKYEYPNISVHEVYSARIGFAKDCTYGEFFWKWFPTHKNVTEYESRYDSFAALERGEVDMIIGNLGSLLYMTNYLELPNYKANLQLGEDVEIKFGFSLEEKNLRSIVDKALNIIDHKTISDQWLRKTYDYRAKLSEAQRPWIIGAASLFLLVMLLVFFLFQRSRAEGRMLEKQVQERTATLEDARRHLASALVEAEVANKAKSKFLAAMSHELRTPLNAILGITEIQFQKEIPDPVTNDAFEKIHLSGSILLGLLSDILDLSKIEADKMELILANYDIARLISDTTAVNVTLVGDKPIKFLLEVDENMPLFLLGDELRIKQILNNILSNAFKYTQEGVVKLSVAVEASDDDNVTLIFTISDTGSGMTEEQLASLFDEYQRFYQDDSKKIEGFGLGMAITKNLVRLMHGEISAESEPGKGSAFVVRLPQVKVGSETLGRTVVEKLQKFRMPSRARTKGMEIKPRPMPHGKVLIVDDTEMNIFVATGLMKPYKLTIDSASSGFEAIEKIRKGNVYDIVFMDHMMPKMDGMEATKIIREMGYDRPIVALTANAVRGQAEIFLANGFDDFIEKPINTSRLDAVLNGLIREK